MRNLTPFVWPEGRPDLRLRVVLAVVALIAAKIVTVLMPLAYKAAVDGLTEGGKVAQNPSAIWALALTPAAMILTYGLSRLLAVVFTQFRDIWFTKVALNAVRKLAERTFRHIHSLSLRFHLERRTGALSRVIERGVVGVELITRMAVLNSIPTLFELLLIAGMLSVYFGWIYVVTVLAMIGLYVWFTFVASERRIAIRRDMNDSDTDANAKAVDSLLNYETVKYFGNEDMEAKRYDSSMARYERAGVRTYASLGVLNTGQAVIFNLGLTLCMAMAARDVMQGALTVGDFVMINTLLIQLYMPLNFMGMVYREIKQALVDLEQMFELLAKGAEVKDKPGAKALEVDKGEIRFVDVSFAYDPERPILREVSFTVPAGKMVAIVGPSGAGKSTISRILFRFYEVASGHVEIDGQDIAKVTQDSLRAAIGMVPQDTVLFNDTIEYNIHYGRPDASAAEVREAARLAQIDRFIRELPDGYDTMVGERGLKLSGGEKQRVAIARTLLKRPPILMLDEATSALDSHTEKDIQEAIDRVSRNRTTLVIAHRLSTVVHADDIIVLDQGRIIERGKHQALLEHEGLYAGMWNRQREAEAARARLAHALNERERALNDAPPRIEIDAELETATDVIEDDVLHTVTG